MNVCSLLNALVRAVYSAFLSNLSKKQVCPKPTASVTYLVLLMPTSPKHKVQKSRDEDGPNIATLTVLSTSAGVFLVPWRNMQSRFVT